MEFIYFFTKLKFQLFSQTKSSSGKLIEPNFDLNSITLRVCGILVAFFTGYRVFESCRRQNDVFECV